MGLHQKRYDIMDEVHAEMLKVCTRESGPWTTIPSIITGELFNSCSAGFPMVRVDTLIHILSICVAVGGRALHALCCQCRCSGDAGQEAIR